MRPLLLSLAVALALPGLARAEPSHRVQVALSFSHWFGPTFGSPEGFQTPSLLVGIRPGVSFLELRLRYAVSLVPLPLPDGSTQRVGFASLEVVASRTLSVGGQSLEIFAGPLGLLDHAATGVSGGLGVVLGFSWLIDLGPAMKLGPTCSTRGTFALLPGERDFGRARRDAQVDLGLAATWW